MTDLWQIIDEAIRAHAEMFLPSNTPIIAGCSCTEWAEDWSPERNDEVAAAFNRHRAEAVLDALHKAGETQQRWREYDTVSGGSAEFDSLEQAIAWHEKYSQRKSPLEPKPHPCVIQVRTVTTWPDGSSYATPWLEVTSEVTDD